MKYIATTVVALLVLVFPSKGETLRLEGESFRPKAHIIWAATNAVPPFVTIYKMAHKPFLAPLCRMRCISDHSPF